MKLSNREAEVMSYIADGFTHDQIGQHLRISRKTVEIYVKHVRMKLDAKNTIHAAVLYERAKHAE